MARSVAINVGANTNQPGFRGPIAPDRRFRFVPIPETEPTREPVPTYANLELEGVPGYDPASIGDVPVHLDPSFAGEPCCEAYTYGDPHPVKAGPISSLSPGDWLLFYATLSTDSTIRENDEPAWTPSRMEGWPLGIEGLPSGMKRWPSGTGENAPEETMLDASTTTPPTWVTPEWGTYLVGEFRIERVLTPELDDSADAAGDTGTDDVRDTGTDGVRDTLAERDRTRFRTNAHLRRRTFDARVLVAGDPEHSRLYPRAIPLSSAERGSEPNRIVTDLSDDSGKGPWWRRPLRFSEGATATLREIIKSAQSKR